MTMLQDICCYQKSTEVLCSKRLYIQLIWEISHDSNIVRNSLAYYLQEAAIIAVQDMADVFLVSELERK